MLSLHEAQDSIAPSLFEEGEICGGPARLDAEERSAAGRSEHRTAGGEAACEGEASYFTKRGKIVTAELRACGCKLRFCERCCVHLGLLLHAKLLVELATWAGLQMWTLTVDPKLFASPEEAFRYVRKKRCVARLVAALRRQGLLRSARWVCVVEWQMGKAADPGTQMAHYHLLLESKFLPFEAVARAWGKFRPKSAPQWQGSHERSLKGQEPEFGHVRFSKGAGSKKGEFKSSTHAASYVCKYLTKQPEKGYPDWVLDFKGQIHRFTHSRRLFPVPDPKLTMEVPPLDPAKHEPDCFCKLCNGDITFVNMTAAKGKPSTKPLKSLRDRLSKCGQAAALFAVVRTPPSDGGADVVQWKWLCTLKHIPFARAKTMCALGVGNTRRVPLSDVETHDLIVADASHEWRKRQRERDARRQRYQGMCSIGLFD